MPAAESSISQLALTPTLSHYVSLVLIMRAMKPLSAHKQIVAFITQSKGGKINGGAAEGLDLEAQGAL